MKFIKFFFGGMAVVFIITISYLHYVDPGSPWGLELICFSLLVAYVIMAVITRIISVITNYCSF